MGVQVENSSPVIIHVMQHSHPEGISIKKDGGRAGRTCRHIKNGIGLGMIRSVREKGWGIEREDCRIAVRRNACNAGIIVNSGKKRTRKVKPGWVVVGWLGICP